MSRQTFSVVAPMLGVLLIGFSALSLAPEPGAGRHEATANDPAPFYGVDARTSVVVDQLDGAARDTTAAKPAGAPRVAVRVVDHRGYSRVVFDWRWPVEYKVVHTGGEVEIRFARAADIDFAALNASPPQHVRTGRSEIVGKRTNATLAIDPAGRLRYFRSGTEVVFDVLVAQARPGPDVPAPAPRAP